MPHALILACPTVATTANLSWQRGPMLVMLMRDFGLPALSRRAAVKDEHVILLIDATHLNDPLREAHSAIFVPHRILQIGATIRRPA